jgi:hypothetical protein
LDKQYVTIKKSWLHACGHRTYAEDTEFQVVRTMPQTLPDGTHMYVVLFRGREWVVAEWRCDGPAYQPARELIA